jgi:hypothetical protein
MAEVLNYFKSKKNMVALTKYLCKEFAIDNVKGKQSCFKLLNTSSDKILHQCGNVINSKSSKDSLKYLNTKLVQYCKNIITNQTKKQSNATEHFTTKPTKKNNHDYSNMGGNIGYGALSDASGGSAPIANGDGEYICADGTMGKKFGEMALRAKQIDGDGVKGRNEGELERRMLERRQDYGDLEKSKPLNFSSNGMMMNPDMMNPDMMNLNTMNPNMMNPNMMNPNMMGGVPFYNPNPQSNSRDRPPEFDFTFGLGGQRQQQVSQLNNMVGANESFTNLRAPDQFDGNQMDFTQFGMNNMGSSINMNAPNMGVPNPNNQMLYTPNGMPNNPLSSLSTSLHQPVGRMQQYGTQPNSMPAMKLNPTILNNPSIIPTIPTDIPIDDELTKKLNEYKKAIAKRYDFDPQMMLSMSADDIKTLIDKMKRQEEEEVVEDPKEKIKQLLALKKMSEDKLDNLNNTVSKVLHQKKKHEKKKKKQESSSSESDNSSSESSDSEEEKKKKHKKKNKIEEKKRTVEKKEIKKEIKDSSSTTKIEINSKDMSEPEYFNDYMIDVVEIFKKPFVNVDGVVLKNIEISTIPEITEKNCNLSINTKDKSKSMDVPVGKYKISGSDGLISLFNSVFTESDSNLEMSETDDNKIKITQTNGEEFEIISTSNSILNCFGFTSERYEGKSEYTSENSHLFVEKPIYLYITNISQSEPVAEINTDNSIKQLLGKFDKINEMKQLIIQFRKNTDSDDLADLFGIPHKLTLEFTHKN